MADKKKPKAEKPRAGVPTKPSAIDNTPKLNAAGRRSGGVNPTLGLKKDGTPANRSKRKSSTTGRGKGAVAEQSNWRVKLHASRIKFDDERKAVYIMERATHGLKGRAADAAGVDLKTVLRHIDNDPDFADAVCAADQQFADTVQEVVHKRGVIGWTRPVYQQGVQTIAPVFDPETGEVEYDAKGNIRYVPVTEEVYDSAVLQMQAKRVNPEFRDKGPGLDVNMSGGVLVVERKNTPEEAKAEAERVNATKVSPAQRRKDAEAGE